MKIDTLVVGLGNIGMKYSYNTRNHYENHCESISSHKSFNLVGGVDIDIKSQKLFKKKYKLPVYRDLFKSYKKLSPEMIVISTPTSKNINIFKVIKKKKIKPKIFLLEKPGSYNLSEFENFIDFCNKNKINVFVNYTRSYSNFSKNFFNLLKKINFGKIKKIKIFYRKGIFNSCSHYINFLLKIYDTNNFKIINVLNIKKFNKDFLINFNLQIFKSVIFKYTKEKIKEKIIFFGDKKNLTYITELSEVYYGQNKIKNDFRNNLKNVLDYIIKDNKKIMKEDLLRSITTLKIISLVVKNNKKI
jgi:hypothetical protein